VQAVHRAARGAQPISCLYKVTFFQVANFVDIVHLKTVYYERNMKTFQHGTCEDRIVTVRTSSGEHIVTIKN